MATSTETSQQPQQPASQPGNDGARPRGKTAGPLRWLKLVFLRQIQPNLIDFVEERQPLVWTLALAIGIGAAYLAILFRELIGIFQLPWLGSTGERVYAIADDLPTWLIIVVPAIGGLIVGLLLHYVVPGRRAQGVADVIEARALLGCRIPLRTGLGSALVSAVSIGSGASVGREGPVVHLGATLASALEDLFKLPHTARRVLLACGVAAAVSASFNAPIAGVLFALEVILAHYALRAFVPITIASVAATVIARIHLGDFPAFILPKFEITSYWEFPAFALLGITCAGVAIAFYFAIVASDRLALSVDIPLWTRPVIGGLMVGVIATQFPQVLGVGYDATDAALKQFFSFELLVMLLIAKIAATAISLASRFGGGVFSPSLYLGAMTGGAFGILAASVFPDAASSSGLYAVVGMGAVAAAVLGAPISTVLIVFELTGDYPMAIALLLAVSISTGLTQAVHGQSFFAWQLSTRGLFLQEGPHKHIAHSLRVRDFMTKRGPDDEILKRDEDDKAPWLTEADTVETALRALDRAGVERIAVVDKFEITRIVGWVEHLRALNAYNEALIEAHEEEHK